MFAYIKGTLDNKANNYIVIDVGGIGYKIFMSRKSNREYRSNWNTSKSSYSLLC